MNISGFAHSYFVWIVTLLLLGLMIMPVIRFLRSGWPRKREDILESFTDYGINEYFKQFYPSESSDKGNLRTKFESNFNKRFGRSHFTLPMVFLIAVAGIQLFLLSGSVATWLKIIPAGSGALPPISAAAMAGAYMWVLGDLIARNQRLNLAPVTISWGAFRFVTAVPFAYAFGLLFADSLAVPIAFLIGVFPIRTLRSIAHRLAVRNMNIGELNEKGISELERLQCINTTNAEAFAAEGISTIGELAYADPIDLTIRTSLGFSYVVDSASQALAWIYFEDKLEKMRIYSLRGAQEIANLIQELDDDTDPDARDDAKSTLNEISKDIEVEPSVLERTLREIAGDPYTCFLCTIWHLQDEDETEEET